MKKNSKKTVPLNHVACLLETFLSGQSVCVCLLAVDVRLLAKRDLKNFIEIIASNRHCLLCGVSQSIKTVQGYAIFLPRHRIYVTNK